MLYVRPRGCTPFDSLSFFVHFNSPSWKREFSMRQSSWNDALLYTPNELCWQKGSNSKSTLYFIPTVTNDHQSLEVRSTQWTRHRHLLNGHPALPGCSRKLSATATVAMLHFLREPGAYVGLSPLPVRVTTRIIVFLVGDPYKPSFPLLLGGGTTQSIRDTLASVSICASICFHFHLTNPHDHKRMS